MRIFLILMIAVFYISCNSNQKESSIKQIPRDPIVVHDTVVNVNKADNWQEVFGLTHDPDEDSVWFKPVSYYLNDPDCSSLAKDFYYGSLRPADDGSTEELLKLATTGNNKLRPFYRWCLNMTISIQDGALAEHTGIPARKYAEKFPVEFFNYMDADTSGSRNEDWISAISYSGFYQGDDYKKSKEIASRFASKMKSNCNGCSQNYMDRIDLFANTCF